jgi:hypothetical protein
MALRSPWFPDCCSLRKSMFRVNLVVTDEAGKMAARDFDIIIGDDRLPANEATVENALEFLACQFSEGSGVDVTPIS